MSEQVLCIPSDCIRSETDNIKHLIDRFGVLVKRRLAEKDARLRQVIPYIICQRKLSGNEAYKKEVWCYRRRTGEPKLKNQHAIGVGGHLNSFDYDKECARELYEETGILWNGQPFAQLGLLLEDEGVGKVHVGVVHKIYVDSDAWRTSKETADGKWMRESEIAELRDSLESWSRAMFAIYF